MSRIRKISSHFNDLADDDNEVTTHFRQFFARLVAYADAMHDFKTVIADVNRDTIPGFKLLTNDFDGHAYYSGRYIDEFEDWIADLFGCLV